jgi:hypothetical protein
MQNPVGKPPAVFHDTDKTLYYIIQFILNVAPAPAYVYFP